MSKASFLTLSLSSSYTCSGLRSNDRENGGLLCFGFRQIDMVPYGITLQCNNSARVDGPFGLTETFGANEGSVQKMVDLYSFYHSHQNAF